MQTDQQINGSNPVIPLFGSLVAAGKREGLGTLRPLRVPKPAALKRVGAKRWYVEGGSNAANVWEEATFATLGLSGLAAIALAFQQVL